MRGRFVPRLWILVLAVLGGGLAAVPALLKPGASLPAAWIAAAVVVSAAVGSLIDHGRRNAESVKSRRDQVHETVMQGCLTLDGRRLPSVRDVVDPTVLGVHQAASATTRGAAPVTVADVAVGVPPYVGRDVDTELRRLVANGGFVLLVGDSTAGKGRAAYEAIQAERGADTLLVPRTRADVAAVAARARQLRKCVIWLDDLERFVGPADGLNVNQVAGLQATGGAVLICATLRAEERSRLENVGRTGDESNRILAREVSQVLRMANTLHIERRFSRTELQNATAAAGRDVRIRAALEHADDYGLAEYLAAGPQLLSRWRDGWAPGHHPRGAALVLAAVDCRRTGLVGPTRRELLIRLHEHYLSARGGSRLRPESIEAAFDWATQPLHATTALLHREPGDRFVVFDYVVDNVQRQATVEGRVPEDALRMMLDYADLADTFAITDQAVEYGWYDLAAAAAQRSCELAAPLPARHSDALLASHQLARIAMWRGEYRTAWNSFSVVLAQRREILGPSHPDTLATWHDYSWVLSACGQYDAAIAEFEALLAMRREVLGPDHRLTLSTHHNLAWAIFQSGDSERARSIYERVLEDRTRTLGPHHESITTTRHDLARVATALGDYDFAEKVYAEALEARTRTLGDEHPYVLTVRHTIGALARARGNLADAERQLRAVLHDRSRILGHEHPHSLATGLELARLAAELGRAGDAAAMYTALADDVSRTLGTDHPLAATIAAERADFPDRHG